MSGSNVDFKLKKFVERVSITAGYEPFVVGYLDCLYDFGYIDTDEYEKYVEKYIHPDAE
jgi:hypothetical protein